MAYCSHMLCFFLFLNLRSHTMDRKGTENRHRNDQKNSLFHISIFTYFQAAGRALSVYPADHITEYGSKSAFMLETFIDDL